MAATLLATLRLTDSHGAKTQLAVALVSGGSVGIVWALVRVNEIGWSSAEVVVTLMVGIATMVGFVLWERRAPEQMLPLRLFRNPSFVAAILTGFLMVGALFSAAFLAAQYFPIRLCTCRLSIPGSGSFHGLRPRYWWRRWRARYRTGLGDVHSWSSDW